MDIYQVGIPIVLLAILVPIFLAPSIVAYKIGKRGLILGIVVSCNILIGWSGFGWIIAMALAVDRSGS